MAKLYFYYSAMNAGKSATLLQSNHNYRSNGMHTALFTPRLDDRYGEGQITSRIGLQASALAFEPDFDFFAHLTQAHAEQSIACILIDESQFLTRVQVLNSLWLWINWASQFSVMGYAQISEVNHLKVLSIYWRGPTSSQK